jgi:hypothetical protein
LTGPIGSILRNAAQVEIIFISSAAVRWALSSCRRSSAALSMRSALGAEFLTAGVSILRFSRTLAVYSSAQVKSATKSLLIPFFATSLPERDNRASNTGFD